jgi:hypothetical protein
MKDEVTKLERPQDAVSGAFDPRTLARTVEAVLDQLRRVFESAHVRAIELEAKFEPAIRDIISVEIATLATQLGSFSVDNGTLRINEEDVARLFDFVLSDMSAQLAENDADFSEDDVTTTLEDALGLFALHEVRHRTQGVGSYSTIQLLKKIDGREEITRFDVQADRDAALALAACRTMQAEPSDFLEYYQRALYYSVRYFFKLYPANRDRIDKTCRVAALLLMLARLEVYRTVGRVDQADPTLTLHVKISTDRQSIAVLEGDSASRLIATRTDDPKVATFVRDIEDGNLDKALVQAIHLAVAMKI